MLSISLGTAKAAELVAPYVDTVREDVELILKLADVGPQDYLVDLGSGDGRFVIEAAKRGAMALGVELDKSLIEISQANARAAGVAGRASFLHDDLFDVNFSMATVVTLYLMPEINLRLRPILLKELKPGTRVVSNSFDMGDWTPDARAQGRTSGGALLWYIPADVRGDWSIKVAQQSYAVQFSQRYQDVIAKSANTLAITEVKLQGATIRFEGNVNGKRHTFHGEVSGDRLAGAAHPDDGIGPVRYWRGERLLSIQD